MKELKPCPFCGGKALPMYISDDLYINEENNEYVYEESCDERIDYFRCYGCDSVFFHDEPHRGPKEQIEWWNRRYKDEQN